MSSSEKFAKVDVLIFVPLQCLFEGYELDLDYIRMVIKLFDYEF